MLGQVELEVKSVQIAPFLFQHFLDVGFGKDHAAFRVVRVRQRHKTGGKQVLVLDLLRGHSGKVVPRGAGRQLRANSVLHRFAAAHLRVGGRLIGQIVALGEQVLLPLHHGRLLALHLLFDLLERLLDVDRRVTRRRRLVGQSRRRGPENSRADGGRQYGRRGPAPSVDKARCHSSILRCKFPVMQSDGRLALCARN